MTGDEKDKEKNEILSLETMDRKELGARLREAREYVGLSQDEVARYLSIPRTALSHIETGQRRVDALELKKLCSSTNVLSGILQGKNPWVKRYLMRSPIYACWASGLSSRDREELQRFAEYLRARAQTRSD